ncbi:type B 50S ribosomal protein L31 [Candidatus Gracilibacteria bacterium]|nr:type B 50S ribosomal protein L31 [Candidatus Gracilibacteria bacterium]
MKTGIHPESQKVAFVDRSANFVLIADSTANTKESYDHEGTTYPCIFIETSSVSHPFYTGEQKILKTGAVDKFYARQKKMEEMNKKKK